MSQEATTNHPTPEEMHRLKQRNQYQLMLAGLGELADVLPPAIGSDKTKSKQILLSEAVHYIHYLQLCIFQLGNDTGRTEDAISRSLHWDVYCVDSCGCLQKLRDVALGCSYLKSPAKETNCGIAEAEDHGTPCTKLLRRSSTPTLTSDNILSSRMTRRRSSINGKRTKIREDWRLSPIKSPKKWTCPWLRAGDKGRRLRYGKCSGSFQSPPGPECDIITPPSSYRRTIIEDSPKDQPSSFSSWENVSVRKSNSPWMPKPDSQYGSVEDLAEKIVSRYGQDMDLQLFDDDAGHVLSKSHPLDSFLDSSHTEDETIPFTSLEATERCLRPRPKLISPQQMNTADFGLLHQGIYCEPAQPQLDPVSEKYQNVLRLKTYGNLLQNHDGATGIVDFSPGLFLTSKRSSPSDHWDIECKRN